MGLDLKYRIPRTYSSSRTEIIMQTWLAVMKDCQPIVLVSYLRAVKPRRK